MGKGYWIWLKVFSLPLPPEDDTTFPFSPKSKKYSWLENAIASRAIILNPIVGSILVGNCANLANNFSLDRLMAKKSQPNVEQYQDVRLSATTRIWVITVAILGVCVPLSAVTRSGAILPLVAIGGAAVGTVAVWRSDEQKSKTNYLQQQQIELLERRLANLETIVSSDDLNLQMKIKQIEARDTFGDSSDVSTIPRQPKRKG
ncbi:hypothetical protein [Nostoc sp. ATCC 53789]|nr:hypothetical protein [Nostoc sp. ATCC 53789]